MKRVHHVWLRHGPYDYCPYCGALRFQVHGVRSKSRVPKSLFRDWTAGGIQVWSHVNPDCKPKEHRS